MNLEQFGQELKQARLVKQISLLDISAETRINLKFLEAIELGRFQILPQTYVRAFLREFALMVDLDPAEIMKRYDNARQDVPSKKPEESSSQQQTPRARMATENLEKPTFSISPLQRNIILGVILVGAVAVVYILATMNKVDISNKSVAEVPFDHVVRESEAASMPPPYAMPDTSPVIAVPKIDSLRLQIITHDSVWISLLIDGKKGEEYLFGPNRKRTWIALERFVVTMGNAGGATFQLNGKDIGALGKRGAVLRNAVITEATLKN
jgi:cytoskeleton protein RodZ